LLAYLDTIGVSP